MARMDAAFEAYAGLRNAGLVNDNLLAQPHIDEEAERALTEVEKRPSMVEVEGQLSIWPQLAKLWRSPTLELFLSTVTITYSSGQSLQLNMVIPCMLPSLPELTLFIDASTKATLDFGTPRRWNVDQEMVNTANEISHLLMYSVYRSRMEKTRFGFPVLFIPYGMHDARSLQVWKESMSNEYPATDLLHSEVNREVIGMIRNKTGARFAFDGIEKQPPAYLYDHDNGPLLSWLRCKPFPKRSDFLHQVDGPGPSTMSFEYLDAADCTVDRLPSQYSLFARMIPTVLHHIERYSIAEELRVGLLAAIGFTTPLQIITAIFAGSAHEGFDYQRFEFLGDAVLKMFTSVTLMAQHPKWHEGYLAHMKDHIVSNGCLALATQRSGLVKYIRTKQFTAHKWKPMYVVDLINDASTTSTSQISTKILADVIEALIGAAYLFGGFPAALSTLKVFLPEVNWQPIRELITSLTTNAARVSATNSNNPRITQLEAILGYTFNNKSLLLEAMTHPSLTTSSIPSYQRLEFLGDAVLDYVVTTHIFNHSSQRSVHRMHGLRTATVNAGILAHCALSSIFAITTNEVTPSSTTSSNGAPTVIPTTRSHNLTSFLRHGPVRALSSAISATETRHHILAPMLLHALFISPSYPWRLLAAFAPEKTVSDNVEAVLGAVWVDTNGDWDVLEGVMRKLGLLRWLERAMEEGVKCWHPKEEVGTFGSEGVGQEDLEDVERKGSVRYKIWRSPGVSDCDDVVGEGGSGDDRDENGDVAKDGVDGVDATIDGTSDNEDGDSVNDASSRLELGKGTFHCRLSINGEHICTSHGWNRLEVETAAAEEAIVIMNARRRSQGDTGEAVPLSRDDKIHAPDGLADEMDEADGEELEMSREAAEMDKEDVDVVMGETDGGVRKSPRKMRRSLEVDVDGLFE